MNPKLTYACMMVTILLAITSTTEAEADRELDFHCPDTVRSMIHDGCRHLQRILKQRALESRNKKQTNGGRNKRHTEDMTDNLNSIENETYNNTDNDSFSVQFMEHETHENFMKSHRLYNARRSSYPEGAHLILNHRGAKILRSNNEFKIEPRSVNYRSVDGKLVKDHTNRHRRYTEKHEMVERMAACCQSDSRCLVAFCLASP